jgi:ABC-2 type transport system ATP-binding protein
MAAAALTASNLHKRFGAVRAVQALSLRLEPGEIYGLIGKNGAGKTTTIRMLLGLVRPTRGLVSLFGSALIPGRSAPLARVGALVETAAAYPNLTVRENLELRRRLTQSPAKRVSDTIALLGLEGCADRPAGKLSLGNKQRLALAGALLHEPDLLVLDEPTNGLDPEGIVEVRELLRRLSRERGVAVLLSSHQLTEVARLADRLGIVQGGRLLEETTAADLQGRARRCITVDVSQPERARAVLSGRFGDAGVERVADSRLRVIDPDARPADVARLVIAANLELEGLTVELEDLEAYFLRLTREAS